MKKLLAIIMVLAVLLSLVGCKKTDVHRGNIPSPTVSKPADEVVLDTEDTVDEVVLDTEKEESADKNTEKTDDTKNISTDCMVNTKNPTNKKEENKTSSTNKKPQENNEKPVKLPAKNAGIKKIVDESYKYLENGNIVKFYEANGDEYFTVSGEKDGIIIYFKDGTEMGVVDAFKNKLVTISDLKKYKVKYIKEWLHFGTFDLTETYDCDVEEKPQVFYKDKYFSYSFSSQKSQYVKYLDKDGKTWFLSDALKAGVTDMETAGIFLFYDRLYIGEEILILDETEKYMYSDAPSRCFFTDEKYEYYYPEISFINVYYPGCADEEDLKVALKKGKVKLSDLDKHNIAYYKVPISDKNKEFTIVDHTKYYDFDLEKKEEEFYRDDKYVYLFPTQKEYYVYLVAENVNCRVEIALCEGKVDINYVLNEFDKQKITYIKRPIGKK